MELVLALVDGVGGDIVNEIKSPTNAGVEGEVGRDAKGAAEKKVGTKIII